MNYVYFDYWHTYGQVFQQIVRYVLIYGWQSAGRGQSGD